MLVRAWASNGTSIARGSAVAAMGAFQCKRDACHSLGRCSTGSKRTYRAALNMISRCNTLSRAQGLAGGQTAPATLTEWIARPSCAWPAIQAAYPAARTQQQAVKCILAVFKYGLDCSKECLLSETHSNACGTACGTAHAEWHTVLRQLDQQVRAQVASCCCRLLH